MYVNISHAWFLNCGLCGNRSYHTDSQQSQPREGAEAGSAEAHTEASTPSASGGGASYHAATAATVATVGDRQQQQQEKRVYEDKLPLIIERFEELKVRGHIIGHARNNM